jgi:hypothetical protein
LKKKWVILLVAVLVAVITAGVGASFRPRGKMVVEGNLSASEVAAIKRTVTKDMRARIFPKFSWKNIKKLPANYRTYSRNEIIRIQQLTPLAAMVYVGDFSQPETNRLNWGYGVFKSTNEWRILSTFKYEVYGMTIFGTSDASNVSF